MNDMLNRLRPPLVRTGPVNAPSAAVGAIALGALAAGALAIGALAIGRLVIRQARIRRLDIDTLHVGRIEGPPPRLTYEPQDAENLGRRGG